MYSRKKSNSNIVVVGSPRVILTHEVYERVLGWMNATNFEVRYFGLADSNQKDYHVKEVYLPKQRANSANVKAPPEQDRGDISKWMADCVRAGKWFDSKTKQCRATLHMHKHPGASWSSLFESSTDENNTENKGTENRKWLIVGRCLANGKFRIALEVYSPYRFCIDFLPVYVEYAGKLFKVSEPNKTPELEKQFDIEVLDSSVFLKLEEGVRYYADAEIEKPQEKKGILNYATSLWNSNWWSTKEKKNSIYIGELNEQAKDNELSIQLQKQEGIVSAQLVVQVNTWQIVLRKTSFDIELPKLPEIRIQAAKEVAEKVSAIYEAPIIPAYRNDWGQPLWNKHNKRASGNISGTGQSMDQGNKTPTEVIEEKVDSQKKRRKKNQFGLKNNGSVADSVSKNPTKKRDVINVSAESVNANSVNDLGRTKATYVAPLDDYEPEKVADVTEKPVKIAKKTMEKNDNAEVCLGIEFVTIDKGLAKKHNIPAYYNGRALVTKVELDSTADKCGIAINDVVLRFNGQAVIEKGSLENLINSSKVGDEVLITFSKAGKVKSENIVLEGKNFDKN